MNTLKWGACLAAGITMSLGAQAQEPLKIGFITTLSTPAGYLGEDSRAGFELAIDEGAGTLGGVPVQLVVEDDGLQPAKAKQIVDRMSLDGIHLYTGVIFSNVLAAVVNTATSNGFYVTLNTAPSTLAGEHCMPNYFVGSYQNDTPHEMAGITANEAGYKKMVILAPNYQGGRDAMEGFKRTFKGQVTEIYTKLNQLDYSVEMARIRALAPDAIYQFHPGGGGINFAKQYGNSGLSSTTPMIAPVFSMDERMLAAVGEPAKGMKLVTMWNPQSDNPANQAFIKAYTAKYHRVPTFYAAQSYDTARMIGATLKATHGNVTDQDVFRTAMRQVKFDSIRGHFSFDVNQHPRVDWYLLEVQADASGKLAEVPIKTIATEQRDSFADQCKM